MDPLSLRELIEAAEEVVQEKLNSPKPDPVQDFIDSEVTVEEVAEKAWDFARKCIVRSASDGKRSTTYLNGHWICEVGKSNVKWVNVVLSEESGEYETFLEIMVDHFRADGLECVFQRTSEKLRRHPRLLVQLTEFCDIVEEVEE